MANKARGLGRAGLALLALGSSFLAGCATNPATGRSQIMLISEQQEIAMGQEADRDVGRSMGVYENAELQDYIQTLGTRLARDSERPDLPWSFKVVDDSAVNAFALPGGFIYVTRGILGHLGSEAQLATVLGHEIGHVTARHSANQISKAQLANLGLGVGLAVAGDLPGVGTLLQTGAGLMFLKFSRDDERQADDLGLRYAARSGYDLRESPEVHVTLKRASELSEGGRLPGWMSTHPEPENRVKRMEEEVAGTDFSNAKVERRSYLRRLDGLVWGENPREGYFEGDAFLHPQLAFRIDFPPGWKGKNQKQYVVAASDAEDAVIVLTLTEQSDPAAAARQFIRESGVEAGRPENGSFNSLPATWFRFEAVSGQTPVTGKAAFVKHGGQIYQLLGYTASSRWSQYSSVVDRSLQSFARLKNRKALAMEPARLEIVELPRDMTLREFANAYPSTVSLDRLAVINQTEADTRLAAGNLIKRVVGGPESR